MSKFSALFFPDPRLNSDALDLATSTLTQAGIHAASPTPQAASSMVLEAGGEEDRTLEIGVLRSGRADDIAAFQWRPSGGSWRGWDGMHILASWDTVVTGDGSNSYQAPHMVRTEEGIVILAYVHNDSSVRVRARDPGGWGSETTIYTRGAGAYTVSPFPTLCILEDGRVALFFWLERSTEYRIQMWISGDNGATWSVGQKNCRGVELASASYTPYRFRVATIKDNLVLLAQVRTATMDQLWQWVSEDEGASFSLVTNLTDEHRARLDIAMLDGQAWIAWLEYRAGTAPHQLAVYTTLGDAADPIDADAGDYIDDASGAPEWATYSAGFIVSPELAIWTGEAGDLYALARDVQAGATSEIILYRYTDGAWERQGTGSGPTGAASVVDTGTSTYRLTALCALQDGAQALVAHTLDGGMAWEDSIYTAALGGYSTVTMPRLEEDSDSHDEQTGWVHTWLALQAPDTMGGGWTYSSAGAPTVTAGASGVTITGSGSDATQWQATPTGSLGQGLLAELHVTITTGIAYLELETCSATPLSYGAQVRVAATAITLYDINGGLLATAVTTAGASGVVVRLAVGENTGGGGGNIGKCRAWYRLASSSDEQDWTLIGSSSTLIAGTNSTDAVRIGTRAGTTNLVLRRTNYSHGAYTGNNLYTGADTLLGRPFSTRHVTVGDASLAASAGVAWRGQTWLLSPAYDFGIERTQIDVSSSPSVGWRSEDDASDVEIVWDVADDPALRLGSIMGLYLGGINFAQVSLDGRKAGGTWELITAPDLSEASGLHWTRKGDTIQVTSPWGGTEADRYWPEQALAGCYFQLSSSKIRKIIHQSEGWWREDGKQPILILEGIDGTEATSGTAGKILPRESTILVQNIVAYDKLRLTIPAQDTAEGYFQAGVLVWGTVFPFSDDVGQGRKLSTTFRWELEEARGGQRRVESLSAPRKSVEIAWPDMHDSSEVTALVSGVAPSTLDVDGVAIGTKAGMILSLSGLLERLGGAVTPVVYLPAVDIAELEAGAVALSHPMQFLYGMVRSEAFSAEVVVGSPFDPDKAGEAYRSGGALRIEAIL